MEQGQGELMAIGGFDGSITINTTIETGDINAQFDDMSNSLRQSSEKLFTDVGAAAKKSEQVVAASFSGTAGKVKDGVAAAVVGAKTQMDVLKVASKSTGADLLLVAKNAGGAISQLFQGITKAMPMEIMALLLLIAVIKKVADSFGETLKVMAKMPLYSAAVNQLKSSFSALKSQFATLAAPLVALFIPVLQRVVDWLTNVMNVAAQVIAALSGQETYMQAVATSSGEYAGNMEAADEAAKGQLASFDKLNVLAPKVEKTPDGGGATGGGITWKKTPIDPEILGWWEKFWQSVQDWAAIAVNNIIAWVKQAGIDAGAWIKQAAADALAWIIQAWTDADTWVRQAQANIEAWLKQAWTDIGAWLKQAWVDIVSYVQGAWDIMMLLINLKIAQIKADITTMKDWITQAWTDVKDWVNQAWTDIKNKAVEVWDAISAKITGVWDAIVLTWQNANIWFATNVIDPIKTWVDTQWDAISAKITGVWDAIKLAWQDAASWFDTTIWQPIATKAGEIWAAISGGAMKVGVNVANGVVSAVNGVIGFLNSMISGLQDAINGLINLVNTLPFVNIPNISLPTIGLLPGIVMPESQDSPYPSAIGGATGLVAAPNAPFMAILGDQKRGTNVEAPLATIEQAVENALSRRGSGGTGGTIRFDVDESGLMRYLHPKFDSETKRVGSSLATKAGAA